MRKHLLHGRAGMRRGRKAFLEVLGGQPGRARLATLFFCLFAMSSDSVAGGSGERVSIERLDVDGVEYTLLVAPEKSEPPDAYMGACAHFEVRGSYQRLRGAYFRQHPLLSRNEHIKALEYLRRAFETKQSVYLVWMGTGFVPIDPGSPCVVRSRALRLLTDERGTYVVSFHDMN
jgi:hypothetical protein